jgi:alanyl-tRNA synthetase
MKNIIDLYQDYCSLNGIPFKLDTNVKSYDNTTLFCPAGMQQFKDKFKDNNYTDTIANVQTCIRMNDFNEIGDGTHLLAFNMVGLFSFREYSIKNAIDFWMEFLTVTLELKLDYVTVHPDVYDTWKEYYTEYNIEVKSTTECYWTDGEIGGYCTEFFINDVEIGNIVNPLGDCIDVGFGLERLDMFVNGEKEHTKEEVLKNTINILIDSGFVPSPRMQGYVLRKLLRELYVIGGTMEHQIFKDEIDRQEKLKTKYLTLKEKHKDKPKEWWLDTHGIDLDFVN